MFKPITRLNNVSIYVEKKTVKKHYCALQFKFFIKHN